MLDNQKTLEARLAAKPPAVRDLGPKQIEWLKAKVPSFDITKQQADRARAHAMETAQKIEGLR